MNKIVRILPGIFLSLLSLSSCDGLFTEDCIYKGYLHARNGFRGPEKPQAVLDHNTRSYDRMS